MAAGSEEAPAVGEAPAEKVSRLQASLEGEIANEDPFSGELVVRHLGHPFVMADELDEVSSWAI